MSAIQLHTCGLGCPPSCKRQENAAIAFSPEEAKRTIDFHCHAFVPEVEGLLSEHPRKFKEAAMFASLMGEESIAHNQKVMLPDAGRRMMNIDQRLQDMDEMGVGYQVISPAPSQYYYWAEEELSESIVDVQNRVQAELAEHSSKRFFSLGTIALQHPKLAVDQLRKAVKDYGLKGVQISTQVEQLELSDPSLKPFWKAAEELGAVVFIHPFAADMGKRLQPYYLSNTIGQPLETTIALSQLIYSGRLDDFPHLKLVAAHGGGYLPAYIGRSDHAARVRPEASKMAKLPSEYLKNIWFDTLVYSSGSIKKMIEILGDEQLLVGTDYPFDMGGYDFHALFNEIEGLTDSQRKNILYLNAQKLLGIDTGS